MLAGGGGGGGAGGKWDTVGIALTVCKHQLLLQHSMFDTLPVLSSFFLRDLFVMFLFQLIQNIL